MARPLGEIDGPRFRVNIERNPGGFLGRADISPTGTAATPRQRRLVASSCDELIRVQKPLGTSRVPHRIERGMDARTIYTSHAAEYDELVRAEDAAGQLLPALLEITPLQGQRVVEVGAGTGRVTALLLAAGAVVCATEREPAMLGLARQRLSGSGSVKFMLADARQLPLPDAAADVGVAAWVFGHFRSWVPDEWREQIGAGLDELGRVVKHGGHLIVIETLGTNRTEPAPPEPELAEYYTWLENERGFKRQAIRSDYAFASVEEATRVMGFFFGEAMAASIRDQGSSRVPECTGLWSLLLP
jgi:ubiquinone/menaquinone biosynthesis C-methylase UbiE